ncbi:MAG: C10 family peptidase [Bacteroidales bacterium]|nr:C10 family peptidase [Bacteroidales bacterium]
MIKKIRQLFLVSLLSIAAIASANPVDTQKAAKVATNFWKSNHQTSKFECDLQNNGLASNEGFSTFYIFENAIGYGFVIVAADDCVTPILAYSATDHIGGASLPTNQKNILQWYERQINYCVTHNVKATENIAFVWQKYLSGEIRSEKSANYVRPMLTTKWNQSPIYNDLCPYDGGTRDHTYAGCVAVAMAQTLKYWNHPITGVGSNSYSHDRYGTISVDFNNTTYDWANMPNQLNSTTTYEQNSAVATLMFHCGVSCNMYYGTDGSSAGVNGDRYGTSEYAFKNFFGYKSTLWSASRENYSDSAWTELLREELDNKRPVMYTGYDYTDTNDIVGHAFVCDGYDTNDYFHFNWGWGGQGDGYFELSNLNPSHVFNTSQRAIIGMEPDSNLLRVTPTSVTIDGTGGSKVSMVISNPADSSNWIAYTQQSWITISRTSGPGLGDSANITITASENTTGHSRNGCVNIVQDSQYVTIYVSQPDANHSPGGWYGNDVIETEETVLASTQNAILIRPESYGNFAPGDKITHIKFRTRKRVPGYNNSNFTIKIFRNTNFSSGLDSGECATSSVLGRVAFTENYSITNFDIDQIVSLSTPYTITNAPFWIALQTTGGTLYKARRKCISNIPDGNAPVIDSLQVHYLKGMADGSICPALELTNNAGSWTQCEIEYYFQFMVELGKDGIEEQPHKSEQPTVKVYPNPTSGIVNFSEEVKHVDVFDNMGRRVSYSDNTYTIDISSLRKGLYTLRITTEQGTVIRKVVKQK